MRQQSTAYEVCGLIELLLRVCKSIFETKMLIFFKTLGISKTSDAVHKIGDMVPNWGYNIPDISLKVIVSEHIFLSGFIFLTQIRPMKMSQENITHRTNRRIKISQ